MADRDPGDDAVPEREPTAPPLGGCLYLRRNGEVKGPFASGMLARHLELGRLGPQDEVSEDRIAWWPLDSVVRQHAPSLEQALPPLVTTDGIDWREERRRARRRWIDERSGRDRRTQQSRTPEAEARTGADRRQRADHASPLPKQFSPARMEEPSAWRRSLALTVLVIVLLGAIGVCLWVYAPRFVPRINLLS